MAGLRRAKNKAAGFLDFENKSMFLKLLRTKSW